jgi:hypothetical protein
MSQGTSTGRISLRSLTVGQGIRLYLSATTPPTIRAMVNISMCTPMGAFYTIGPFRYLGIKRSKLHFRLCILGISKSHPMMQPPRVVKNVAFRTHDSKNLMEAEVSGKKKGGAIFMSPRDMICTVTMDDDSSFRVYACVRGSVIEVHSSADVSHSALAISLDGIPELIQN